MIVCSNVNVLVMVARVCKCVCVGGEGGVGVEGWAMKFETHFSLVW